jgi:hypothetical protein
MKMIKNINIIKKKKLSIKAIDNQSIKQLNEEKLKFFIIFSIFTFFGAGRTFLTLGVLFFDVLLFCYFFCFFC